MIELLELKNCIETGRYTQALTIIGEMEEMSREDKINKIYSYMIILLMHLIKQHAEKRSASSWERSIYNSVEAIRVTNKRRKAGGYYAGKDELADLCQEAYPRALKNASYEAFEGRYDTSELSEMVIGHDIRNEALKLILQRK
jgi:hypothetical protein